MLIEYNGIHRVAIIIKPIMKFYCVPTQNRSIDHIVSYYNCSPIPLNFSIKATIFWNTVCFFVRYSGFKGLILGKMSLKSVPFSVANLRFNESSI